MDERVATGIVKGRGHGGLAIFTRRSTVSTVSRLQLNSTRLIAARFQFGGEVYSLLNVYLPYNSNRDREAAVEYLDCLAHISDFVDLHSHSIRIVLGDYNCDFGRLDRFAGVLSEALNEGGLHFVDRLILPEDTSSIGICRFEHRVVVR